MSVSAAIITLNEADNLARCLRSLEGLVQEVVVVDCGSTDETRQIACNYGARVVEHPWEGFVGQKNFALQQCRHPWVFSIDADEEISPALREELGEVLPHLDRRLQEEDIRAYAVPRRVFYLGRWIRYGDWNPDFVTRLCLRESAHFAGGAVHESLVHEGKVQRLQEVLHHYTYQGVRDHVERMQRYSTLWAEGQAAAGQRAGLLSAPAHAGFRFLRALLLKRGLMDGWRGVLIASLSAYEVFLKYRKLRKMGGRIK